MMGINLMACFACAVISVSSRIDTWGYRESERARHIICTSFCHLHNSPVSSVFRLAIPMDFIHAISSVYQNSFYDRTHIRAIAVNRFIHPHQCSLIDPLNNDTQTK